MPKLIRLPHKYGEYILFMAQDGTVYTNDPGVKAWLDADTIFKDNGTCMGIFRHSATSGCYIPEILPVIAVIYKDRVSYIFGKMPNSAFEGCYSVMDIPGLIDRGWKVVML